MEHLSTLRVFVTKLLCCRKGLLSGTDVPYSARPDRQLRAEPPASHTKQGTMLRLALLSLVGTNKSTALVQPAVALAGHEWPLLHGVTSAMPRCLEAAIRPFYPLRFNQKSLPGHPCMFRESVQQTVVS